MLVFWVVLAVFYLILAIVTYVRAKPILKWLKAAAKIRGGIYYTETEIPGGGEAKIEQIVNKAFRDIIIINVSGFILASAAAVASLVCPV